MILQALTQYYEQLERQGKIAGRGWSPARISFALQIAQDGALQQVTSVQTEQPRGTKTVLAPQVMNLPTPVKRTVGVAANFLWDNSSYILGIDNKGKPERTAQCFAACKALHEEILKDAHSPAADALLAFFQNWDPQNAAHHPALAEVLDDVMAGGNLVFRFDGRFLHEDDAVRQSWQRHYGKDTDGPRGLCLVTGEEGPVEAVHPSIKNMAGVQSSSGALVAFNAAAYCSYGKEQSLNAPTGKYAAFAYTSALNHLLADRDHVYRVGDTTVLCWAKNAVDAYNVLFGGALLGSGSYSEADLQGKVGALCRGQSVEFEQERLDPDMEFYVLGLSPNAARISVRFFLHNSFGELLKHIAAHDRRLEIVRPSFDSSKTLPVWRLLSETVNQKARDKSPAPNLAGELLRSILHDTPYPATLLNGVELRIRAEREFNWRRAAILKAYYLKNPNPNVPKEVLQVSLNPDSTNVPYTLGRLFSVLEGVQSAANPGIGATIKDRYFNSAASTPANVFPILINLAQKHLKKLAGSNKGLAVMYDKQITELLSKIDAAYPTHMNLPEQGAFQLGYYHQTQARYTKKEEN